MRKDKNNRTWERWESSVEAEHGWASGDGVHAWVIATPMWREGLDGPKPESTEPADDSLFAVLKDGSAADEAEGFDAATAWVGRAIQAEALADELRAP